MRPRIFSWENKRTSYIQLDTQKCKACWKCTVGCPNQVIGKVDLPWHKHALIVAADTCTGCLKCIKVCQYKAISKIDITQQETAKKRNKTLTGFIINNLLLISGIMTILSGLIMQLGFHIGGHGEQSVGGQHILLQSEKYEQLRGIDMNKFVWGLNYPDWSTTHKIAIVLLSIVMTYHFYAHLKWYKNIIAKGLIRKNHQAIILSVLFLLVALTGLIPWFIDQFQNTGGLRLALIEIHDKIALVLIIYLILHVTGRIKWYSATYARLSK